MKQKRGQRANAQIDLSPSTDFTLRQKIKALFASNPEKIVAPYRHIVDKYNPLSDELRHLCDKICSNYSYFDDELKLECSQETRWDGATIYSKLIGTIFLLLSVVFFTPFLILAWVMFVVFDGQRKFAKAGLWHDSIFQHGQIKINGIVIKLSMTEANQFFKAFSKYYGKSFMVRWAAFLIVFLAFDVWNKYRNNDAGYKL